MQFHPQQAARAFILLGFSVMLYMMHVTGDINLFINPKYLLLSKAAAFLFSLLFSIQITRVWTSRSSNDENTCGHDEDCCSHEHHHDHGTSPFSVKKLLSYSIIILPLLTGFMLPANVLDSSIAYKKGGMLSIAGSRKNGEETKANPAKIEEEIELEDPNLPTDEDSEIPEGTKTVTGYENVQTEEEYNKMMKVLENDSTIFFNDSIYSSYYEEISANIDKFQGRRVSLYGFVYKEDSFKENQLVVSRFLVTHCIADASIIGFLSEFPDAPKIEKDTWIKIEGVIEKGAYMGNPIPLIQVTKWEEIKELETPYLYPISIRRD